MNERREDDKLNYNNDFDANSSIHIDSKGDVHDFSRNTWSSR